MLVVDKNKFVNFKERIICAKNFEIKKATSTVS